MRIGKPYPAGGFASLLTDFLYIYCLWEYLRRQTGLRALDHGLGTATLNAHENEPTFAQFSGPTECAGLSNVRVLFRVVDRLVDWKREARFCIDGHDSPFAWSR
jgi:hypothetical protein